MAKGFAGKFAPRTGAEPARAQPMVRPRPRGSTGCVGRGSHTSLWHPLDGISAENATRDALLKASMIEMQRQSDSALNTLPREPRPMQEIEAAIV